MWETTRKFIIAIIVRSAERVARSAGNLSDNRFMRLSDGSSSRPTETELAPGAVSGLSHIEAPESLDEAVRIARVLGIIAQIDQMGPRPSYLVRGPEESKDEFYDRVRKALS